MSLQVISVEIEFQKAMFLKATFFGDNVSKDNVSEDNVSKNVTIHLVGRVNAQLVG
jgi:hypothetical protein